MKKFIKIRYYVKNCTMGDAIIHRNHSYVIVNTNEIMSLDERHIWNNDERYKKYPFRRLWMTNGDVYLLSVTEGDRVEKILLEDEEQHEEEKPQYVINEGK